MIESNSNLFLFTEFILRSAIRYLGEKWTTDQRSSNDLYSSEFLQFDGRYGFVLSTNLCNTIASELLSHIMH